MRGNLRSKGDLDVSEIAANFGGGGHHAAAGFSNNGTIRETLAVALPMLAELVGGGSRFGDRRALTFGWYMARRTPSQLNMLLAVDKPVGCTSHDVVSQCRRALHERRVGHAGTLDPMASGVMVVGVGRDPSAGHANPRYQKLCCRHFVWCRDQYR